MPKAPAGPKQPNHVYVHVYDVTDKKAVEVVNDVFNNKLMRMGGAYHGKNITKLLL